MLPPLFPPRAASCHRLLCLCGFQQGAVIACSSDYQRVPGRLQVAVGPDHTLLCGHGRQRSKLCIGPCADVWAGLGHVRMRLGERDQPGQDQDGCSHDEQLGWNLVQPTIALQTLCCISPRWSGDL